MASYPLASIVGTIQWATATFTGGVGIKRIIILSSSHSRARKSMMGSNDDIVTTIKMMNIDGCHDQQAVSRVLFAHMIFSVRAGLVLPFGSRCFHLYMRPSKKCGGDPTGLAHV